MAKFSGIVGYSATVETSPGVWKKKFVERNCYGDLVRGSKRNDNSDKVNNDISVDAQVSIIADPYARVNFMNIAYVEWQGIKWKVTSVDPTQYPRIILNLGGLFNEG